MQTDSATNASDDIRRDISTASDLVAPTWPLDRFIAVNPYWGWRGSEIAQAAAQLGVLAGTRLTMPRDWFRDEWRDGRIDLRHLEDLAADLDEPALAAAARDVLKDSGVSPEPPVARLPLVTDVCDMSGGPLPGRTWTEVVAHQIGQHCAAYFDEWQAAWPPNRAEGLFASWRHDPSVTHGFRWHVGRASVRSVLDGLPVSAADTTSVVLDRLAVPPEGRAAYLTAVLASVNGWAAWCAYRRWQAGFEERDDDALGDLLAIRLAWELLLAEDMKSVEGGSVPGAPLMTGGWSQMWSRASEAAEQTAGEQRVDWLLQTALERTYQASIGAGFSHAAAPSAGAQVQAVFCIDVRSELLRRALESTDAAVHTRGFAGFFGLPISYTPAGSALVRPQLPGLLAPTLHVGEVPAGSRRVDEAQDSRTVERRSALAERGRWNEFRRDPSSVFSFVESMGLYYGVKLVAHAIPHAHGTAKWENDGLHTEHAALRPRLELLDTDPAAAAALAHKVLLGMGLTDDFAPVVMLCGHGSHSENNPHAAGLDCGACGGQTGEVNARVLADLVNDEEVRLRLNDLGVVVPESTWFVAALHNTTTDNVTLFDTDLAPEGHHPLILQLEEWLREAGDRVRAERAPSLGLGGLVAQPRQLERSVLERANDWSQVRPEWGLAGNAAFVVAPRWRTRHLDLGGRCFLHDYDWRRDPDRSVLTLIMTAPMVVTNWINMQYHASTVDNRRYGSGNKVLHNVVGGNIGVFEGNGGDLRIGLPMQSLHDGHVLRHQPLRLSVFIEAPAEAIDAVIADHQTVHDLVSNGWLHLLRIESETGMVERRTPQGWEQAVAR